MGDRMKKPREVIIIGDIAYVTLTQGYVAKIDAANAQNIGRYNWCADVSLRKDGTVRSVYATRGERVDGKTIAHLLHRDIANPPCGLEVDHIDGDGLNCLMSNLRVASDKENSRNRRLTCISKSGSKGVYCNKKAGKWHAQIAQNGVKVHLGYFTDIQDASAAYADASARFHGEFGRTE